MAIRYEIKFEKGRVTITQDIITITDPGRNVTEQSPDKVSLSSSFKFGATTERIPAAPDGGSGPDNETTRSVSARPIYPDGYSVGNGQRAAEIIVVFGPLIIGETGAAASGGGDMGKLGPHGGAALRTP